MQGAHVKILAISMRDASWLRGGANAVDCIVGHGHWLPTCPADGDAARWSVLCIFGGAHEL